MILGTTMSRSCTIIRLAITQYKDLWRGLMQFTLETFCKEPNWIPETVKDWKGKEHPVLIVPALFCKH